MYSFFLNKMNEYDEEDKEVIAKLLKRNEELVLERVLLREQVMNHDELKGEVERLKNEVELLKRKVRKAVMQRYF